MRRAARWIAIGVGILLGAIAAAVASILVLLHTPWAGSLVRGYAVKAIDDAIAGSVRVADLSLSLHQIALRNVVVRDPSGAVVAVVPRVVVRIELAPLLHRTLVVKSVQVVAPRARIVLRDGSSNLERALARTGPHHPLAGAIDVRELSLRGGRLLVQRDAGRTLALVEGVTVGAHGNGDTRAGSFSVAAEVHGRSLAPPRGGVVVMARAAGTGGLDDGRAQVRIGDEIALGASASGGGHYRARIERLAIPPRLAKIVVASWPLVVPVDVSGGAEIRGSHVRIDVDAHAGDARLAVTGALDARDLTTSGVSIELHDANPARLLGAGPSGDVDAAVRVRAGSLAPKRLDARAHVDATAQDSRFGQMHARATARVTGGRLQALSARLSAPGVHASLDGHGGPKRLPNERLTVDGRIRVERLSRLTPSLHGRGSARFTIAGTPAGGASSLSAQLRASLPRLRVASHRPVGRDRFAGGRRRPWPGNGLRAVALHDLAIAYGPPQRRPQRWTQRSRALVEVGAGRVAVRNLALASDDQSIALSASRRSDAVAAHVRVRDLDLRSLAPLGIAAPPLELSARVDLRGTSRRPRLDAVVDLVGGQFGGPALQTGKVSLRYRPGTLSASARALTTRGGELRAKASMPVRLSLSDLPSIAELTARPLHATVRLDDFQTGWLADAIPSLSRVRGTVDGNVVVDGTAASPEVRANVAWRDGAIIGRPRPSVTVGISARETDPAPTPSGSSATR